MAKVAAIVPALNEEGNIANVLKVLLASKYLNEVILVDDGSSDRTAEIGRSLGAKVLSLPKKGGSGKSNAMRKGVESTDAEVIAFFDADLINFKEEHIESVVKPVLENKAEMCIGVRVRYGGISELFVKIDPLLAIGGERAMKRYVFLAIPEKFMQGFMVETTLNYFCKINKLKIAYTRLKGLEIIIKEKKWGFWKGFKNRIKMIKQLIKIRFLIIKSKSEFINKPQ